MRISGNITVDYVVEDLRKTSYIFCCIDGIVFLEHYYVMKRETKRHAFKIDYKESYARIHNREFGLKEEPEVPFHVQYSAVSEFRKTICFKKWSDR